MSGSSVVVGEISISLGAALDLLLGEWLVIRDDGVEEERRDRTTSPSPSHRAGGDRTTAKNNSAYVNGE